ncbi:MAG: mannitol dehydrogenase family protein [Eubacteriales bacterium]|nr:mannitol dehydrogenase family protein [Eubacteriales bacterium]
MRLNTEGLQNRTAWEAAGYRLPSFDREKAAEAARRTPQWIHFGAGNIFRAFQANLLQTLLEKGSCRTGLIAAEGFDYEIIEKINRPCDDYSILVTLKADGTVEKSVVASVVESRCLDSKNSTDFSRLKEIFAAPSLQLASFTITEKGYSLTDGSGQLLSSIRRDFAAGPAAPESYLGKVCALLYARYEAGRLPIALVSMDNCSHNGTKVQEAVFAFARHWCSAGCCDAGFEAYVHDAECVSYPWSMIDKITPRPDPKVQAMLEADGVENPGAVVTAKHTWTAPFVNAEECQYLVVEDDFPNGRPPLEEAGVIFTSRQTVDQAERMKVCTCLNPLHTALAVFGCLLGDTLISEEMKNPLLKALVERIGYQEGLPVVVNPGILDPRAFLDEVVNVRIPNPFLPDTPQRIATDTSQKLPIRFGETLKAYQASPALSLDSLVGIPLVFAGWLRYLLGVDDTGKAFTPSPDPLLETMQTQLSALRESGIFHSASEDPAVFSARIRQTLSPILCRAELFGVDLFEAGLAERVTGYFAEMLEGPGAVARTLQKYLS